ncbi:hypothetical protein [Microbacterium oleivorans]|nr:hypothetical protein [Microbacterium oleivorans]
MQALLGLWLWRQLAAVSGERPRRSQVWWLLRAWYVIGANFAAAVAGSLVREGEQLAFGISFAAGAFILATTAGRAISAWHYTPSARGDVASFLMSTHVLAFLVLCAFAVAGLDTPPVGISNDLVRSGTIALTTLAIPVSAGVLARLRTSPDPEEPTVFQSVATPVHVRAVDVRIVLAATTLTLIATGISSSTPLGHSGPDHALHIPAPDHRAYQFPDHPYELSPEWMNSDGRG